MKARVGIRLLSAIAAVVAVGGCTQLATPVLVDGVDGKKVRIDGYGLDASLVRGGCNAIGQRLIEVQLRNNSEDAYVLYEIKGRNLSPLKPQETTGEIPPNGSKTVVFVPTVASESVSTTIAQLQPEGTPAEGTTKVQGLEPRAC